MTLEHLLCGISVVLASALIAVCGMDAVAHLCAAAHSWRDGITAHMAWGT